MELNNKTESLKENGKTFYWASKLIDKKKFNDISELYYILRDLDAVSYTHLTLPTNREV